MTKAELRQTYLNQRKLYAPGQLRSASEAVAENLFRHFNLEGKCISLFLPIERQFELDTYLILEKALALDAKVGIPRTDFSSISMKHYLYSGPDQLETRELGLVEPKGGKRLQEKYIEVALIPMIVCDVNGHRVGYGKGFYDRFLSKCKPGMMRIGLSHFDPVAEISDVNRHDQTLNYCVSPNGVTAF